MVIRVFGIMAFLLFNAWVNNVLAAAKIDYWQTPQGSRVYYVQTEGLPMVDIQVVFDAGSARDDKQFGIASLTADLLDAGAGQWNADEIAKRFESVGAQFGAGASTDFSTLSLRSLTDKALFDKALETMQVILAKPAFNKADFSREQKRTLAVIKQSEESPGDIADIAFSKVLYGDHPYAHPTIGTLKTVAALTPNALKAFYKQYYVATNAMVVIVGDVNKAQAEQIATQLLSGLAAGNKPANLPDVIMPTQASKQHVEFPSTQTHVLVGLPGSYRKDPDYFPLYVGNHVLGGSGLVSKLFDEVREKRGLAYSASSSFAPLLKQGPFTIGLQTRNDQTTEALDVLNKTLNDFITRGPSADELKAAKQNIIGGFALRFDTNKELANYVTMIGFYDLPLDYLDNFKKNVEQVTIANITDAFIRRVKPALLQTVTVGQMTAKQPAASDSSTNTNPPSAK